MAGDPLAAEWTWGLVAVAGLALLKRYESFLIAVLRAHQEFALTTELDVFESLVSVVAVALGLWLAGFWGLLGGGRRAPLVKIAYLHARHPLRFRWAWDAPTVWPADARRPADPGQHGGLRRGAEPRPRPDPLAGPRRRPRGGPLHDRDHGDELEPRPRRPDRAWSCTPISRRRSAGPATRPRSPARPRGRPRPRRPLLAAGSAVAYLVGPVFLGALMPATSTGLPALRPLLPGMILLGLAWPARQMLIAIDRPYRLCLATLLGLALTAAAGSIGADRAGIVGVAWGMTIGYAAVYVLTSATAFVPLGWDCWWVRHQARLARTARRASRPARSSTAHVPLGLDDPLARPRRPLPASWPPGSCRRSGSGARRHGWGGLLERWSRS